jgi:rod shape determining protein RodA
MSMEGIFGEGVDRIGGEPISARMARKAPMRHIDFTLLLTTIVLAIYGAAMVYTATAAKLEAAGDDPNAFVTRQSFYFLAGTVLLVLLAAFDYRHLSGLAPILYGGMALLLVAVLTPLGQVRNGTKGWFDFGLFDVQPAELAKIAVIIAAAAYLAERKGDIRARDVGIALGIIGFPSLLIFAQPDLGTMMVFLAFTGGLLLVGGARLRHFAALGLAGIVAVLAVFQFGLLKDYQVERLTSFLDPNPDVRSVGYNLTQSKIAIGSGGMKGKGIRSDDTQTSLEFVPEQHTDFIFTAVGEQLGFIGSATLLGLYALLIWRALRIATMSRDMFGTLLASGIAAMWAFQVFLNVGMTMGIMPITGVPLPFMSYGGSAMVANFVAVGLLMNVHMRRFLRT